MDVRIHAARHYDLPGRIDNARRTDLREASRRSDRGNLAVDDG